MAGRPAGPPVAGAVQDLAADRRALVAVVRALQASIGALGPAAQVQHAGGWIPERLARLRAFRADRSPLVASAAQFTFPADEERPGGAGRPGDPAG